MLISKVPDQIIGDSFCNRVFRAKHLQMAIIPLYFVDLPLEVKNLGDLEFAQLHTLLLLEAAAVDNTLSKELVDCAGNDQWHTVLFEKQHNAW